MNDDNIKLAELLFPQVQDTVSDIQKRFPKRDLPAAARVTRFAPSPTGFIHLGNLYCALVGERLAHTAKGVFYLRIEDTDKKREVDGGREYIISCLEKYNINFDEGFWANAETGMYGPYIQSERAGIYQVCAKHLVAQGHAYPCFCTEEELDGIRKEQEKRGAKFFGYFGEWAKHRCFSLPQIKDELDKGRGFTLRFKADPCGHITKWTDGIRGEISVTENEHDFVLLKSNGIPTYHFAHVIDDCLMGTTDVIRGEEWLPSLPIHLQLFGAFGWEAPRYAHISPIMKIDPETHNKRKLSKRADSEAAVMFYEERGYPRTAVIEYLMSVMNSDFDEWRLKNPDLPYGDFPFNVKKMCVSGAVFDIDKLNAVSRNLIAKLDAAGVYHETAGWARIYDGGFYKILTADEAYSKNVMDIAYKNIKKPRKDFALWSEVKSVYSYFYDELFDIAEAEDFNGAADRKTAACILIKYGDIYSPGGDAAEWFEKMKDFAKTMGFAASKAEYGAAPDSFKGTAADVAAVLRYAVTGRHCAPDLFHIFNILGEDRVRERFNRAAQFLENTD